MSTNKFLLRWPGNVRELENILSCSLKDGAIVQLEGYEMKTRKSKILSEKVYKDKSRIKVL